MENNSVCQNWRLLGNIGKLLSKTVHKLSILSHFLSASHHNTYTETSHTTPDSQTGGKGIRYNCRRRCMCVCLYSWWEMITWKIKIQLSKPLVMRVETKSCKRLCDSSFSPRPNSWTVLLELALSDLLCLHIHFTVKNTRERLSLVSGASMQKVPEESERAHVRVSFSFKMLKTMCDRRAQISGRGGQRGRD